HQADRGDRRREARLTEEPDIQRRVRDAALDQDEQHEYECPSGDRPPRLGPAEAVLTAVDDAVHQQDETGDRQEYTGGVQPARTGITGVGYQPGDGDHADHHDRDVEQEDRTPPEVLQQQPADHWSDGDPEPDRAGPGPDRPGPFTRVEDVG